jgi:hypothetical protein
MSRTLSRVLLALTLLAAGLALPAPAPAAPAGQQARPICFPGVPGISDCIAPQFSAYWRGNGGLPVFGYPISPLGELTPSGAAAPVSAQWTERNRLERHPENRAPYDIQIGRVGAERLAQLGRDPLAGGGEAGPQPGCLWFPETRHNVCDQAAGQGFKSYWEANGLRLPGLSPYQQSLALFGLPLTTANPEPGPNGELIVTQWFERARMEWRPANPAQSRVLLGLLGREVRDGLLGGGTTPAPAPAAAPRAGTPQIFGVEVNRGSVGAVAGPLAELAPAWVRYNGVRWDEVEPRRGQRRWEALAQVDAELAAIEATGAEPMLIIHRAPAWALDGTSKPCGPVKLAALPDFAAFLGEVVARYSKAPYNVRYYEIGNEPDAPVDLLGGSDPFGCWGDTRKGDNNGAAYGAALKAVYPAIKAANPDAQVVFGGLLLDCDPTKSGQTPPCTAGNFLEGALAAGAGDSFDLLAYHSYIYWGPTSSDWDLAAPKWAHRGGALQGKLAFVREVMQRYGVSKPIVMNEGGLLCYRDSPDCAPGGYFDAQANYAARMFARAWADGLESAVWYTFNGPGWQGGGMLDASQQPRPAYRTTLFMTRLLSGASYGGELGAGAFEGYQFRKGDTIYQVLWTNDGSTKAVPAPAGTRAVYNLFGEPLPTTANLSVGFTPIFVEASAP